MIRRTFGVFLLSLLLAGCRGWMGEIGVEVPASFPRRDIVFQRAASVGYEDSGHSLGFVNADGSGLTIMEFSARRIGWAAASYPAWSPDGSTIVFRAGEPASPDEGALMIVRAGDRVLHCPDETTWGEGRASFLENDRAIAYVQARIERIVLMDLSNCQVIRTYLAEESEEGYVTTPSITQDGRWLAFKRVTSRWPPEWAIVVVDLISGTQTVIGEGCCPSWSPDGQRLAYVGEVYGMRKGDDMYLIYAEGIYIVNRDGGQKRKVASCHFANCDDWITWPPVPSWSPDGKWLVYHRCMVSPCYHAGTEATSYSIFKVNVETGEEVKIVDGGLNPYWRWGEP